MNTTRVRADSPMLLPSAGSTALLGAVREMEQRLARIEDHLANLHDEMARITSTRLAYSPAEVAEITGLSLTHIREQIDRGDLKARKAGRRLLVRADDLETWLDTLPEA